MQTSLTKDFLKTSEGRRVNDILRACVHCGFCNATCPTYRLTGDELDGPRGRIYLIKNFFEGKPSGPASMRHLDRCLTCLSCETTCPSGVRYSDLIDMGRPHMEKRIGRTKVDKIKRRLIIDIFSKPVRTATFFSIARFFKPLLPARLTSKIPAKPVVNSIPNFSTARRKLLTIKGCVQSAAAPQINVAASKVFSYSGIQMEEAESDCCGSLAFHLADIKGAKKTICRNIDSWYRALSEEYEHLVVTSSGCSYFIKQYGKIMQADNGYAEKAEFVAQHTRDLAEMTMGLARRITPTSKNKKVVFHSPCTLQHGQKIVGSIETLLREAGYTLNMVRDPYLCCGSAGSYSLLETELSTRLLQDKIASLEAGRPDIIASANIGCLMHLQSATKTPVKHWIELLQNN